MRVKAIAGLAALAAVAVALVVALPASAAENGGSTQIGTFDPTGAVFTCPSTNYTFCCRSPVYCLKTSPR
jgi:hypothetical protein